jgi:Type I restriction enzyme R protein N terminus (HSDR_N)
MLYEDFDWSLLNSSSFREDSVREELVVPLLRALGYSASGPHLIHRSRPLKHPFVYFGAKPHRVEIIPDYVFEVGGKFRWVLDAKAPSESTVNGRNPAQAYSYAMHPEVRAHIFALCNGRYFTAYHVLRLQPFAHFELKNIHLAWPDFAARLAPEAFADTKEAFRPDLGLHLHRLGFDKFREITFPFAQIFHAARVSDDLYTASAGCILEEQEFCVSFDFAASLLPQLIAALPAEVQVSVTQQLGRSPFIADLRAIMPSLTISCKLTGEVAHAKDHREEFSPFIVVSFHPCEKIPGWSA